MKMPRAQVAVYALILFTGLSGEAVVAESASSVLATTSDPASLAPPKIDEAAAADIHSFLAALVDAGKVEGAALLIGRGEDELLRDHAGIIAPETAVAIASATKWITSAVVMAQVDQGLLTLESRVGDFVPGLPTEKAGIKLAQILSFTAGLSEAEAENAANLEEAALVILSRDLAVSPGKQFAYGGASLAVAGFMAERASGKPWASLYDDAIASRVGFTATHWEPENPPLLGGGLVSNADDYYRFVRMIANDGVFLGVPILSKTAIDAMETNRIAGLEKNDITASIPGNWGYGLGLWCETVSEKGRCNAASSAGAFGTTPFVDRVNGYFGILVTHGQPMDIVPVLGQIRIRLNEALRIHQAPLQ